MPVVALLAPVSGVGHATPRRVHLAPAPSVLLLLPRLVLRLCTAARALPPLRVMAQLQHVLVASRRGVGFAPVLHVLASPLLGSAACRSIFRRVGGKMMSKG